MREIHFYRTNSRFSPVEKFLDKLQSKQAQKVVWTFQLIEELDVIPVQYFKKLVNTDEIWEIRVRVGSDIFRILGFFDGDHKIVLNHAFQKKTQKTQKREIELAEKRKRDYFNRRQSNE